MSKTRLSRDTGGYVSHNSMYDEVDRSSINIDRDVKNLISARDFYSGRQIIRPTQKVAYRAKYRHLRMFFFGLTFQFRGCPFTKEADDPFSGLRKMESS